MRDSIDFAKDVARFSDSEAGYLVDLLRGVYMIADTLDSHNHDHDSDTKLLLGDLIEALDQCDSIEIVSDD